MSKFFFYPVLEALSDGRVIRKSVAITLEALGVLSVLGGVYLLIEMLKTAFQLPAEGTIGGLLFAIIFLATILSIGQIFWYRAGSTREIKDSQFTVIPIVSTLFRTAGEVYATLSAGVAAGGCLFIWFAGTSPFGLLRELGGILPSASAETTFTGGVLFLLSLSVVSFFVLTLSYFLAESSVVLVDVARHVRLLVRQGEVALGTAAPSRCPACAAELNPGSRFCARCGIQVAIGAAAGR